MGPESLVIRIQRLFAESGCKAFLITAFLLHNWTEVWEDQEERGLFCYPGFLLSSANGITKASNAVPGLKWKQQFKNSLAKNADSMSLLSDVSSRSLSFVPTAFVGRHRSTKQDGLANPLLAARWEPEIQLWGFLDSGGQEVSSVQSQPCMAPIADS